MRPTAARRRAQGRREDYARAQQFLNEDVRKLRSTARSIAHWLGGTLALLVRQGRARQQGIPHRRCGAGHAREPHSTITRLAAALSSAAGRHYDARALPFSYVRFGDGGESVAFAVDQTGFKCDSDHLHVREKSADVVDEADDEVRNGPPRPPDPTRLPRTERYSPDRKFVAFVRDHNLWVRNAATGEQMPLSRDGEHFYDYATPLPSPTLMVGQGTEDVVQAPAVFWSPDSKKIATYVMDQRNFPRLTITQSAPPDQFRPKYFSYAYPLPVDWILPTAKLVVFDVARRKQIDVAAKPLVQLYYGGPTVEWFGDSRRLQYREIDRGYQGVRVNEVDATTGITRAVVDEKGGPDFLIDTSILVTRAISDGRERIWSSERDGWNHLYLYDTQTGAREEPDHQRRVGDSLDRSRRREGAHALLQRRRPRRQAATPICATSIASASTARARRC